MPTLRRAAASRTVNPPLIWALACSSFLWVTTGFRPPFLPCVVAAFNPACVRSTMRSRSNWASAPNRWKINVPPVVVANCNHNWFGLQTARFFDRINCDYRGVKTELIANETTLIANKVSAKGTDNFIVDFIKEKPSSRSTRSWYQAHLWILQCQVVLDRMRDQDNRPMRRRTRREYQYSELHFAVGQLGPNQASMRSSRSDDFPEFFSVTTLIIFWAG